MTQRHEPAEFALAWAAAATVSPTGNHGELFTRTVRVAATPNQTSFTAAVMGEIIVRATIPTIDGQGEQWDHVVRDPGGKVGTLAKNAANPTPASLFDFAGECEPPENTVWVSSAPDLRVVRFHLHDGQPQPANGWIVDRDWPDTDATFEQFDQTATAEPPDRTHHALPRNVLVEAKLIQLFKPEHIEYRTNGEARTFTMTRGEVTADVWTIQK